MPQKKCNPFHFELADALPFHLLRPFVFFVVWWDTCKKVVAAWAHLGAIRSPMDISSFREAVGRPLS